MRKSLITNAIVLGLGGALSLPVVAQETNKDQGLEVIMVTAQKRSQSVKEVPISITAVSGEQLLKDNITDSEELADKMANFDVSQTGQGFNITMRGLGSGPNQGFEQTVGTYVDGVYRGRAYQMRSAFVDLERFELLRGPQSTLFGKNTTAGALNITTARPSEDTRGYISANYEFDNGYTLDGAISTGLTDTLSMRAAVKVLDQDGHFYNTLPERDEVTRDGVFARVSFEWQPSDNLNVFLSYQHDEEDNVGISPSQALAEPVLMMAPLPDSFGDLSQYVINDEMYKGDPRFGEDEYGDFEADYLTLNVDWELSDTLTLTSVTGWQEYAMAQSNDGDHGPAPLTYRDDSKEDFEQFSQELRLSSNFAGNFNYIAGLYYQTTDLSFDEKYRIYPLNAVGPRVYTSESDTLAAFAKFDYQFSPLWSASLGVRYSEEGKKAQRILGMTELSTGRDISEIAVIDVPAQLQAMGLPPMLPTPMYLGILQQQLGLEPHNVSGERDESAFDPSVTVSRKIDAGMLYFSAATGTKSGGYDARANLAKDWEFEPEEVTSYEVGAKLSLLDDSLDLNLAIFNMDFEDLQTSTFDGVAGFYVENGAQSTSQGVEVDSRWLLADGWTLSGNVAYLDFTWDEFSGAKCFNSVTYTPDNVEANGVTCNMADKPGAYAPKWSGAVALDYWHDLGSGLELSANVETEFKSSFYTNYDINPFTEQSGYGKVNARLEVGDYDAGWSVALVGKNLTDRYTTTYATDMSFAPAGMYAVWVEPGRTITLQGSYRF